jgi:hypothetical protein
MENKYGRLFTLEDVRRIAARVVAARYDPDESATAPLPQAVDNAIVGLDGDGELRLPPDEPLFLLRGQDHASPGVLIAYLDRCDELGAPEEHLHGIAQAHRALVEWQLTYPWRVKVAD